MTANNIIGLFAAMFAVAIVPGPSDFAVVARSMARGFAHGAMMVGGIVAADALFIVAAIYGLAALAGAMGDAFLLVKYACGAYLIWLGARGLLSLDKAGTKKASEEFSYTSSFLGGFLITLGDPKAILFYLSLLPAFIDISRASITDALVVMLVATGIICAIKLTYAYAADRARTFLENAAFRAGIGRIAGFALIAVGLFLIWQGGTSNGTTAVIG